MNPKSQTKLARLVLLTSGGLVGLLIGLAIYSGLSRPDPSPQPAAGGGCQGVACPTLTPAAETDDQKIATAWHAAATKCPKNEQGTLLYKCESFAKLLVNELAKRGLTGKIITIQAPGKYMFSERWKNKKEPINDNSGSHQGVEVNGKVYDNLNSDGLFIEEWRLTFEAEILDGVFGPPSIVPTPK